MGNLILCSGRLAAVPYYVEEAALHVYSLEELGYYIETNLGLLEKEFMCEELCAWIGRELCLVEMAETLRGIFRRGGTLAEFVGCILNEAGCLNRAQIGQMLKTLREAGLKSEYERRKLRADRSLKNRRYVHAVHAYRALLCEEEDAALTGNVWHNLGMACAGLFLFAEAADCFENAYARNRNAESLREGLFACCCMDDEARFLRIADAAGLGDADRGEIRDAFEQAVGAGEMEASAGRGAAVCLEEWKEDYRRFCRG